MIDLSYYTAAHGDGYPRERAIVVVDRDLRASEVARPSVLHAAESAARHSRLRSIRRRPVPHVLREGHGSAEPPARALLPAAAGGLLRGHRFGTGDCVARDRLVGGPHVSAPSLGRGAPRSFDDLSYATRD